MNYNYSCLLIIVATFVTFAGVNAATLSGNSYLDDSGTIYISTVDTSQGVQVATTTLWSNPANFTGYTLADDVDYFIHVFVKGGNYPNNIIGEFNISDTTHEFANGTQMLGTNKVDWKWGTSWASMGNTPFNVGNNFAGSFALTTENIFRANTWPDYINTSAYFTASIFAVPDPTTYWRGQTDGTWTNANWASDAAGNPAATIPSNTSDVIFSATGAANQNTTLGADFTINSLTVNDTAAVTIGGANTLTITGDNAVTVNSGAGLFTINSNLTLGGTAPTITVNNSPGMIVNGVIDGSAGLIKDGTGTLTLTGVNTYTGGTTISGGTLQIGNGGTSGSIAGNVTNNANITFNRSDALSFGGIISGTGSLTKQGAGTLTLTGANTYSGGTTISGGTLQVNTNNALGTNAAGTSVTSGAAFALNNVNYTTAEALTINGTGISNGGALANIGTSSYAGQITAATNATINAGGGALTLTGGLVKNGTTLTLTGGGTININTVGISGALANSDLIVNGVTTNLNVANTYNGPTFIRSIGAGDGILNANVTNALPTNRTALTMDDSGAGGSRLNLGANQSIASLAGASTSLVDLHANTLTIGDAASSTDFAGVISGTGGLTKDGASTQTLSGANTYTGTTRVTAGLLELSSAGRLASGSSIDIQGGTLTFVGSESVANFSQSAGIMDFDATHPGGVLAGCQLTPGVHNDTLTVSTSTTLGGTINVNKDGGAEFQRGERAVLIDSGPANITGLPATFTHDYTNRNFLVVDNSTGLVTMLGSGVAGQNSNLVGIADLTPNQVGIANAINTNISGNGNILDASVEADQMALLLIGDCNTPPLAGYSLASPESYAGLVDYGTQSIKSYTTAALSMPGFSLDSTAKSVRIPVGTASDPEMMPSTSSKGITSVFAGYSNYSTGTDSSINGADYDISSHGGILGVRHNINRLTLGGFLAVDEGDINSSTLSADADGFLLGAFASYLLKPENNLIITGGITYGDYEYGGTRQSLGLVTFDDVGSEAFDIHLSIEGDVYSTSKVRVTPFLGVQYINSDTDGFTETGLGALSISRQTQDAFFSDLGVKAEYQFNEQLSLNGNMSYTYNFNDSDKNVGAGLGGTPFAVSSPGLGDDFLTIGVGAQYQVNEALRVGVNYRAEFSDDSDVANGVNIGGSYSF